MTEGRVFLAHNVFFDFNFIKYEFSELGYSFNRSKLCTVQLARKFLPGFKSYSLGKICHDLGIENSARHRALGDAYATFELFKLIKSKMDDSVSELSGENKIPLPPMMRREEFESLPPKVGVYYFYDDVGQILYIGKSRNIKRRVTQHLNPNLKKRKDIQLKSLIAKVEFVLIPNELAALLFECHEIKKNRPPFNKALKRRKFPYGLELKKNSTGVFEIISKHNDGSYHPAFLVKSKRMALLRIDSLYTGLVGPFLNEFERNEKIELLIKKIGQDNFNKLIEKIFYQRVPRFKNFYIYFNAKDPKDGFIKILDGSPEEIQINIEGESSIFRLNSDPEMVSILYSYIKLNSCHLVEIAHRNSSTPVGDS
jgi:DNA polymerase III epsilon subunit-like protein